MKEQVVGTPIRGLRLGAVSLSAVLALSACGSGGDDGGRGGGGGGEGSSEALQVALLLPESQTTRYEAFDRPFFEEAVAELCEECEVLYSNANQDAAQQQRQADAALANGADVLVLDPVDGDSAANIVRSAQERNVPVVAYDRAINDAEIQYYVSFDNVRVGEVQAQSLIDELESEGIASGNIVVINGSDTDPNALQFNEGANNVFDESSYTLVPEPDFFTPEWLPENAQRFMDAQIAELGPDGFVGVYAANDGTAGGAISAMQAAGIDPVKPTTGQDAELAAIQRIVAGTQYMTVYKAIRPEAERAAEVAVALARGEEVEGDTTVNNGAVDVPATLFDPVAVTVENIEDTIIADGFYSVEDICTPEFADACEAAGIGS